ncbi:MAG: MATE family efflux transporter [Oceanobacter sp.]
MNSQQQERRELIRLTLPILATQLAQVGMGTVDTVLSGHVSTRDLAAVAIGTSVWLPVWMFLAGLLSVLAPLIAKSVAKARFDSSPSSAPLAADLLRQGSRLGLISGSLLGALLFASSWPLKLLIDDAATAEITQEYLMMVALGFPAVGYFLALRFYGEATGAAARITGIMLLGLLANIPVSAALVQGWFGLPALGGMGCGLGTSLVFFALAFSIRKLISCPAESDPNLNSSANSQITTSPSQIPALLKLGLPVGIAVFFEVSLFTVIALFLTDLGPAIVAGHQVALNVSSITFMLPLSLGLALTVRVGHHTGTGHFHTARSTAWLGVKLNLLLALFNATLITLFANPIANLYSIDPQVVEIGSGLLIFAAIFQLSDATQIAAAAALRGYQDTLAIMLVTFVCYWLVGLGGGYWLAMVGWSGVGLEPQGAKGFWTGLIIALTLAAIALGWRLNRVSAKAID